MARHRWKKLSPWAQVRRCDACGWIKSKLPAPHYGGSGILYVRGSESRGGRGESPSPPPCEKATPEDHQITTEVEA